MVDYSIYPWDEGEMPRQIAEQIGTDWLVFEVTESDGRFIARHGSTGLAATAPSLDALPLAVQAAIGANWPSLVPTCREC